MEPERIAALYATAIVGGAVNGAIIGAGTAAGVTSGKAPQGAGYGAGIGAGLGAIGATLVLVAPARSSISSPDRGSRPEGPNS